MEVSTWTRTRKTLETFKRSLGLLFDQRDDSLYLRCVIMVTCAFFMFVAGISCVGSNERLNIVFLFNCC